MLWTAPDGKDPRVEHLGWATLSRADITIRYRKVDAGTGDDVEQSNIIKGDELAKGEYIDVTPEELEA